jgi:hypothetical protein
MSGRFRTGEWLRPVGAGFVAGVGWGVLARVYMRLVSTDPSFSWSGTLFILGLAGTFGALLGLVHAARTLGRPAWWRLAVLPGLLLFAGPGIVLFPAVLLGGLAWGTRAWWPLRALAAGAALAVPVLLWVTMSALDRIGLSGVIVVGGLWVLSVPLAAAGATWFRRWPRRTAEQPLLQPSMA